MKLTRPGQLPELYLVQSGRGLLRRPGLSSLGNLPAGMLLFEVDGEEPIVDEIQYFKVTGGHLAAPTGSVGPQSRGRSLPRIPYREQISSVECSVDGGPQG